MDRLWAILASNFIAFAVIAAQFGAWLWALGVGLLGAIIMGLLAYDEFTISLGPVGMLRVGKIWSIDVGRHGVYGIGLDPRHVRLRRVKVD